MVESVCSARDEKIQQVEAFCAVLYRRKWKLVEEPAPHEVGPHEYNPKRYIYYSTRRFAKDGREIVIEIPHGAGKVTWKTAGKQGAAAVTLESYLDGTHVGGGKLSREYYTEKGRLGRKTREAIAAHEKTSRA